MTRNFLSAGILAVVLLTGGCATKKYVQQATAPIQARVDQVSEQANKQGQQIEQVQNDVKGVDERAQEGVSAAKEQAMTAESHANDAMTKANQAADLAGKDSEEITKLRLEVANLDDYKQVADLTLTFAFNKHMLTANDKQDLDNFIANAPKIGRYFFAVEGFTDRIGSRQYNEALSGKRAATVAAYLVAKCDIPVNRIHVIGLGPDKPVDDGHTRAARAKNRRVEIKIFSAYQS